MGWFTLGLVSLGFGVIGVILPLLPTTPFLLLSAFALARSSPRLHLWLMRHQYFGPLIENWYRYGAIERGTKIIALVIMIITLLVGGLVGVPLWLLMVQVFVLTAAAVFIITRPESMPVKETDKR